MTNNWCCVTWEALAPELRDVKEAEISTLIEEKSIPKSTFAQIFKILDGMENYCPKCGASLVDSPTPLLKAPQSPTMAPRATQKPLACIACGGTGKAGGDKRSTIKCISCHGKGIRDGSNMQSEALSGDKEEIMEQSKDVVRQQPVDPKLGKPAKDQDV